MSIACKLRIPGPRVTRRSLDGSPRNLSKKPSSVANLPTSTISPQRVASIQQSCLLANKQRQKKVIKKNQKLVSPAESQDDWKTCDAILVTQSELGEEEEMKWGAKGALEQALNEEELHVEEVRDNVFVGNRRGLDLAGLSTRVRALEEDNTSQKAEITSHKAEITSHKAEITSHKLKIGSLEDRLSSLTMSQGAYKVLRNRFISTFKRDKLGNATETGATGGLTEAMRVFLRFRDGYLGTFRAQGLGLERCMFGAQQQTWRRQGESVFTWISSGKLACLF